MNNWGLCINDVSFHDIHSFSYQTRVPIKISHFGQWGMIGTKDQNIRHGFHIPTVISLSLLIKQHIIINIDIRQSFFIKCVHIRHQLHPKTAGIIPHTEHILLSSIFLYWYKYFFIPSPFFISSPIGYIPDRGFKQIFLTRMSMKTGYIKIF